MSLLDEIMAEIGLGHPFSHYQGANRGQIRKEAVAKLAEAIGRREAAGAAIAPPAPALIRAVRDVARTERHGLTLTRTWRATSEAINAHIDAHAKADAGERLRNATRTIRRKYLGEAE